MKSNSGTKTTVKSILVVLVVFLAIGVGTSITNEEMMVEKSNVIISTAITNESKNEYVQERSVRHTFEEDHISTRSSTSSRFETEIVRQKEEEEERLRLEAEEKLRQEAEAKKLAMIENIKKVSISINMDLTQRTGLSKEEFKLLIGNVKADSAKFFYDNSDLIYDLCEKYELNEIFFCGLISAESGWNIASNHRRTNNYISLMSNGKLIRYGSLEEGLEVAAKTLHNKYLSEGGSFYYGKTLSAVRTKFCPSETWVGLVYGRMNQIVKAKNIDM